MPEGDLSKEVFDHEKDAREFLENNEWKAYLVIFQDLIKIEDHT